MPADGDTPPLNLANITRLNPHTQNTTVHPGLQFVYADPKSSVTHLKCLVYVGDRLQPASLHTQPTQLQQVAGRGLITYRVWLLPRLTRTSRTHLASDFLLGYTRRGTVCKCRDKRSDQLRTHQKPFPYWFSRARLFEGCGKADRGHNRPDVPLVGVLPRVSGGGGEMGKRFLFCRIRLLLHCHRDGP